MDRCSQSYYSSKYFRCGLGQSGSQESVFICVMLALIYNGTSRRTPVILEKERQNTEAGIWIRRHWNVVVRIQFNKLQKNSGKTNGQTDQEHQVKSWFWWSRCSLSASPAWHSVWFMLCSNKYSGAENLTKNHRECRTMANQRNFTCRGIS